MDTAAQHTERDRSSDEEERSRSARVPGPEGAGRDGKGVPVGSERHDASGERDDTGEHDGAAERDGTPERDGTDPEEPDEGGAGTSGPLTWRRTGLIGIAYMVLLLLFSHFVLQPFLVPSGSMEPTFQVGDRILVNKLAYRFGDEPRRGDVVVFDGTGSFLQEQPAGNPVTGALHAAAAALGLAGPDETDFVKRVVGTGGDRVVCCDKDGRISVNGVPVRETGYVMFGDQPSHVPFDIVVPEGTLWVMGDHRSQSSDSRDHLGQPGGGMVPVDMVVGRADWIGWPFGRWSTVPRTDAFDAVPAWTASRQGHAGSTDVNGDVNGDVSGNGDASGNGTAGSGNTGAESAGAGGGHG